MTVRSGVIVSGIESTIAKKLTDATSVEDADRIAQGSMMRIGTDAANHAPVKTGLLQRTMTTGIQRSDSAPKGVWDMIQKTDYTLVQEYEHRSKSGFIRNSVSAEEPRFQKATEERFKKKRG